MSDKDVLRELNRLRLEQREQFIYLGIMQLAAAGVCRETNERLDLIAKAADEIAANVARRIDAAHD